MVSLSLAAYERALGRDILLHLVLLAPSSCQLNRFFLIRLLSQVQAPINMENNVGEVLLADRYETQQRDSAPEIQQHRGVYRTRLTLRILSLATCIAISVVLIDSIRSYKKTKHVTNPFRNGSGRFRVWPEGLKLYPTYLLIGAATIAGVFSLLLVIASFYKTVGDVIEYWDVEY